ncbi:alpha/beta fold hydrolase [Escherichia coli]
MSFNAKDMTQGGQIASMRIRMFSQIANIMLYCLFIFFWILIGLVLWVKISWQTFINGCIYWWCTSLEGMRDLIKSQPVYEIQYYGKTFRMNAAQVLHDKYMIWCGEQLWSAFVLASVVALVICLITFFVVSWILGRQGKQQSENEVTGGRQLTDNPKDVARMLKKDGKDSDIRIGDLPIIRDSEIQNFCLHGTVGAGKSEVTGEMNESERASFLSTLNKMAEKKKNTGKEMFVGVTRVLSDNESKVFFEKVKGQYPEMDIKIPFLTVMETLQYKPAESAAKVQCPVLIVIAGQDSVNPPEQGKALYDAVASGTKELYEEADACHYDIYEGAFFERVAAVQTQWFKKHL